MGQMDRRTSRLYCPLMSNECLLTSAPGRLGERTYQLGSYEPRNYGTLLLNAIGKKID